MDKAGGSNSKPPSERPPSRSGSSSSRSTPSLKTKDVSLLFSPLKTSTIELINLFSSWINLEPLAAK